MPWTLGKYTVISGGIRISLSLSSLMCLLLILALLAHQHLLLPQFNLPACCCPLPPNYFFKKAYLLWAATSANRTMSSEATWASTWQEVTCASCFRKLTPPSPVLHCNLPSKVRCLRTVTLRSAMEWHSRLSCSPTIFLKSVVGF